MKIKNIIPAAFILLMVSCKPNLERLPTASIGEPAFWKTADDATLGVTGVYSTLTAGALYGDFIRETEAFTDNAFSQYSFNHYLEISQNKGFDVASYWPQQVWQKCYEGIGRANQVLKHVPDINMDAALKARLLGEASFLRALYYFHLTNLWGDVPLVLEPQTIDQSLVNRTPKTKIVTQILADLTTAETSLPKSYAGADIGRATLGAARALKARVYLYNKMYAEAKTSCQAVMAMGYGLVPSADYGAQFLPAKENNAIESIFEVQYLGATGSGVGSSYNALSGALPNFSDSYNPLKNLVNAFEPGDIRLAATVLQPGDKFAGVTYSGSTSPTGYAYRKGVIEDAAVTNDGGANFVVLRYAEVLLNYAEAQNELSGPDATVYSAVNQIRKRAGLADLPAGLSQAAMRTAIKKERRVEFAFEGLNYFDLLRWGKTDYKAAMDAASGVVVGDLRFYDDKILLWPVPQREIDINPNLKPQNPGW